MEITKLQKKYGKPKLHLFIIAPNNSGSTIIEQILCQAKNIVSFGIDKRGFGTEGFNSLYNQKNKNGKYISPFNQKIVIAPKMYTTSRTYLENEKYWDWNTVRKKYYEKWFETSQKKFGTNLNNKIVIVKSPQNVYYAEQLKKHFPNNKFILLTRNPYAVIEGMLRRHNYEARRALPHWIQTAQKINELRKKFKEKQIYITYEELCDKTKETEKKLKKFLPEIKDLNLNKKVDTPNLYERMYKTKLKKLKNLNKIQINMLMINYGTKIIRDLTKNLQKQNKLMQELRQEYVKLNKK